MNFAGRDGSQFSKSLEFAARWGESFNSGRCKTFGRLSASSISLKSNMSFKRQRRKFICETIIMSICFDCAVRSEEARRFSRSMRQVARGDLNSCARIVCESFEACSGSLSCSVALLDNLRDST